MTRVDSLLLFSRIIIQRSFSKIFPPAIVRSVNWRLGGVYSLIYDINRHISQSSSVYSLPHSSISDARLNVNKKSKPSDDRDAYYLQKKYWIRIPANYKCGRVIHRRHAFSYHICLACESYHVGSRNGE